jgi:hypothetical protein
MDILSSRLLRERINIHDAEAIDTWSRRFGCTPGQLVHAVRAVGVLAADVDDYLEQQNLHRPMRELELQLVRFG